MHNIRVRRREWTDANRDRESNGTRERHIRDLLFAMIVAGDKRLKAYTNYPKAIVIVLMHILRIPLRDSFAANHLRFDPDRAIIITMTYLTCAMHFKHIALLFQIGPHRISRIIHKTMPVMARVLPQPRLMTPEGRAAFNVYNWLAFEEMCFRKFGISHVMGFLDVKALQVASRDRELWCPKNRIHCWKIMFVLTVTNEVLYYCMRPGSWDDQTILERSQFGKNLRDPSNPLKLPPQMKFRDNENIICNTVLVTDLSISPTFSPHIYVTNGLNRVNKFRMLIERFFGMFAALFRYCISRTWIEHGHNLKNMVRVSVALFNFRLRMPQNPNCNHNSECGHDPIHLCHIWCAHYGDSIRPRRLRRRMSVPLPNPRTRRILTNAWRDHIDDMEVARNVRRLAQEELFAEELGLINN